MKAFFFCTHMVFVLVVGTLNGWQVIPDQDAQTVGPAALTFYLQVKTPSPNENSLYAIEVCGPDSSRISTFFTGDDSGATKYITLGFPFDGTEDVALGPYVVGLRIEPFHGSPTGDNPLLTYNVSATGFAFDPYSGPPLYNLNVHQSNIDTTLVEYAAGCADGGTLYFQH